MLVFVVPLQSPKVSKNWHHVSRLAERAINSLLAQNHPDFKVVLVCNEPPLGCPSQGQLTVVQREFPVPVDHAGRMLDKKMKVRVGLVTAREYAPCYIMLADADDCVSNQLAGWCAAHPGQTGWYIDSGWMHDEGSRWILYRRRDFDAVCGSSTIVGIRPGELPVSEIDDKEERNVFFSGHHKIRPNMAAAGKPLARLPFQGAVYNLATGENESGFSLAGWRSKRVMIHKAFHYRLLTRRIRYEFGLWDLNPI